ncbi:MAG TPA: hypothetical protein DHV63_08840 [Pseudomonas sp.]|nr:hypothetical protein [Pseudomonas sp.]
MQLDFSTGTVEAGHQQRATDFADQRRAENGMPKDTARDAQEAGEPSAGLRRSCRTRRRRPSAI